MTTIWLSRIAAAVRCAFIALSLVSFAKRAQDIIQLRNAVRSEVKRAPPA